MMKAKPTQDMLNRLGGLWRQHPRYRGCAGHWFFHEGRGNQVADICGGRQHGDLVNMTPSTAWQRNPGRRDYGLVFAQGAQHVLVATARLNAMHDLPTGPFSVCAMINPTLAAESTLCRKNDSSAGGWSFEVQSSGQMTLNLWGYLSDSYRSFSGSGQISPDVWHALAATWNGSLTADTLFFVDAIQLGGTFTNTGSGPYTSDVSHPFYISNFRTNNDLDGTVSEIRVYNRELSGDEVVSLYQEPYLEFEWAAQLLGRRRPRVFGVGPVPVSQIIESGYESRQALLASLAAGWESIAGVLASDVSAYEALAGLAGTADGAYEALGSITHAIVTGWEATATVVQAELTAWESLSAAIAVSNQALVAWESRGLVSAAIPSAWVSLAAILQTATGAYESLQSTSQALPSGYEALAGLAESAESAYESLGAIQVIQAVLAAWESRGLVTVEQQSAYESLQAALAQYQPAYEALAGVLRAESVGWEAAGRLTVAQIAAWEAAGFAVADIIRLLQIQIASGVLDAIALDAGVLRDIELE